jgi:hypothetical protein
MCETEKLAIFRFTRVAEPSVVLLAILDVDSRSLFLRASRKKAHEREFRIVLTLYEQSILMFLLYTLYYTKLYNV